MKKAIFVDRDGTIILEPGPERNYQVDSLELLEFVPGAISALKLLRAMDYSLVLASNQDGLGTPSFPMDSFLVPHTKMLRTLEGEGVTFDDQLIDSSFEEDCSVNRKPGTGMFGAYLNGSYDLSSSYVIGDRATDIALARNLGAKGILLREDKSVLGGDPSLESSCVLATTDWERIAEFIRASDRSCSIRRTTRETDISLHLDLDGKGPSDISTGLKFLDHMLDQLVHHGGVSLSLSCRGDLEVDEHHSVEDVAIALGEAIATALGDKVGIERYGFALPMDESRAVVLLDFSGRPELVWDVQFTREYVGDVPTEMFKHFFKSLSYAMKCNLYVSARGENNHHLAESIFKAFARALRQAVRRNVFSYDLPSSKGLL